MISKMKFYVILLVHGLIQICSTADWSYSGSKGYNNWPTLFANCAKRSQSPISLPPYIEMTYSKNLGPFKLSGFNQAATINTANNGHTVKGDVTTNLEVSGGGLGDTYQTAQFHFHWGQNNNRGSEHTYNGKTYPAEVHIVNYNKKYGSLSNAADKPDGLAVLGTFFEIGPIHNCKFDKLLSAFKNISLKDETGTLDGFKMDYLLPSDITKYFRYKGSLTTPMCYESVTWTVFYKKIAISEEQMAMFRQVYMDTTGTTAMVDNWRPPQPLNGRPVYISFNVDISGASSQSTMFGLLLACVSVTLTFVS